MRIASIDAIPVSVPKPRPSTSALGTFETTSAGIVRVRTDGGIEGVGEIAMIWHGGSRSRSGSTARPISRSCAASGRHSARACASVSMPT